MEARPRSPLRLRAPNVSAAARLPILRCPINFTWSPRLNGSSSRRQTEPHRTCRFAFISSRRNFNRRNFKRRNLDRVVFATRTSSFPFANIFNSQHAPPLPPALLRMANAGNDLATTVPWLARQRPRPATLAISRISRKKSCCENLSFERLDDVRGYARRRARYG